LSHAKTALCYHADSTQPTLSLIFSIQKLAMSDSQSTSLEKSKIKFLLLEAVHQSALDTLQRAGYENVE